MSKDLTFQQAQRHAFQTLAAPFLDAEKTKANPFFVPGDQITMPGFLIQEQPLTTANQNPVFSFASNSPKPSAILNNIVLGENDVALIYGVQLLIGYGATRNVRQYYSYGLAVDDDVVYRAKLAIKFETNDLITTLDTNSMRTENGVVQAQYDGAILVNPQRIFTGRTSKVDVSLDLGDVSTLLFTPNAFISVRLWIALGAAAAVRK